MKSTVINPMNFTQHQQNKFAIKNPDFQKAHNENKGTSFQTRLIPQGLSCLFSTWQERNNNRIHLTKKKSKIM